MKNKLLSLLFLPLLLVSCNGVVTSSSSVTNSVSSASQSSSSSSESSTSISSSGRDKLSIDLSNMSSTPKSSSSYHPEINSDISSSVSSSNEEVITEKEVEDLIVSAAIKDNEYNKVSIETYSLRKTNYTKTNYTMRKYSNQVVVYNGSTKVTAYNDYDNPLYSRFQEQRSYDKGKYYQIRRYDSTFTNSAYKVEMSVDSASYYLNIGQAFTAYQAVSTFKENYKNMTFTATKDDECAIRATYFYCEQVEDSQYGDAFVAAIDFKIDYDKYLVDFFYTEGYYSIYYVDDIKSIRSHGPLANNNTSYTYTMTNAIKGRQEALDTLPISIEENFIKSIEFNQTEISVSLSALPEDQKYIYLLDYITTDPGCGEKLGAPANNLKFTSTNEQVASVGDIYYLDIKKIGDTTIDVSDSATGATNVNKMIVHVIA